MAKRRSMNRRWSRRSANNSAFLNDDTNVLEDDDDYWQHLNQTNSRPPSGVNMTAATAVLDPDSNLMDSNASASQWEYLEKSSDNVAQPIPRNSSKSFVKQASNIINAPEYLSASDSEASAKVRKKRPLLRKPRNPKSKQALVMNSSDSTVEMNYPPPSQHSQSRQNSPSQVPTRPTSPQDSITSLESEKVTKRRTQFKRQTRLDKSTAISDNSVVLPSQESRRSIIKPRSTFLNRSPEKKESTSRGGARKDSSEGNTSDTDTSELISQPRKMFGQMRKVKVSENPFPGILDETEEANQTEVVSLQETSKSQNKTNDSGNFVLQITPVNSEEQQKALQESKISEKQGKGIPEDSGSSLSEELKVSQTRSSGRSDELILQLSSQQSGKTKKGQDVIEDGEEDDSDDYQSFEQAESNVSEEERTIGIVKDNKKDSRGSKSERITANGDNTEDTVQQEESSIEVQANNDSKTFRASRQSYIKPNKSLVHPALVSEAAEESEDERIVPRNTSKSARSFLSRSSHLEHPLSPRLSASMSQNVTQHGRSSQDHMEADERGKSRRSSRKTLNISRPSYKEISSDSEEEEIINKNKSKLNQSLASRHSELKGRDKQKDINSDNEDISSDSGEKEVIIKNPRHSQPKGQDKQQKINSEQELDVEIVSEDEPLFSPNKSNISGSKAHSPPTENIKSTTEHGKPSEKSSRMTTSVLENTLESENFTRPGPRSSKSSIRSPETSSIQSPKKTEVVKKSTGDPNLDKSHRSSVISSSKSLLELSPNKLQPINQSVDAEISGINEIQRRPGPKSFKQSQRLFLLSPKASDTSKISAGTPESPQKSTTRDNETESLSESSSRKDTRRRTDPSLYELPAKERSPSISVSESDHGRSVSSVMVDPRRTSKSVKPPMIASQTPQTIRIKSKRREIEFEDEEDQPPSKKVLSASPRSPRSSVPSQPPTSRQSVVAQAKDDENTVPTNFQMEPTPSTSSGVVKDSGLVSEVDATIEQKKKLRQLKIDALMRQNKSQLSQKSQSSGVPFDPEEFKRKLKESKKILERMRAKEEEAENKRADKKKEMTMMKVTRGLKVLRREKKPDKIVDRAFIVNGKVYKRPKLPRPKHWVTNKFYKFLWSKMEPKFGEQYRVKSEKFVVELNEVMTVIMRRKKYDNYKDELEGLLRTMAELAIIETRHDFHGFCYDFLPYEFRIKVVPMLQAGNTHNIPFEPEKLMEPILG